MENKKEVDPNPNLNANFNQVGMENKKEVDPNPNLNANPDQVGMENKKEVDGMKLCGKQGRYGRPARPKRLIGRGWPKLGAA